MTTEEKLRALLAEAHDRLRKARYLTPVTMSEQISDLVGRIDAALAEPVDDYDIDAELRLHKEDRLRLRVENLRLTRERDEARAEVERLRDIAMHPTGVTWERHHENLKQIALEEVHAAHAALDDAYQRGADAMREAAAQCVEVSPTHGVPTSTSYAYAAMIRALPLPEDKP